MKSAKKTEDYHHGRLPEACIETGLSLIREKGIDKFSLRDVARELGVSHGAPYKHYPNKEALLAAIAAEGFKTFTTYLIKGRDQGGDDLHLQFKYMGVGYFRFALENPDYYRLMFTNVIPQHHNYEVLTSVAPGSFQLFVEMITKMQAARLVKQVDPVGASVMVWSTLHGFVSLWLENRLAFLEFKENGIEQLLHTKLKEMMGGLLI